MSLVMSEEFETAKWRLKSLMFVLVLNAIAWAVGIALKPPADQGGGLLLLLWAMAVGVTSTWLIISHVLVCRMNLKPYLNCLLYILPSLLLWLVASLVGLPKI